MRLHRGVNLYRCQAKAMFRKCIANLCANYKLLLVVYVVVASFIWLAKARNDDFNTVESKQRATEIERMREVEQFPMRFYDKLLIARHIQGFLNETVKVHMNVVILENKVDYRRKSLPEIYEMMKKHEKRSSLLINLNMSTFPGFAMLFAAVSFALFYVKVRF